MDKETKNEVKAHVATSSSTAAGAVAGVVIGSSVAPTSASAQDQVSYDIDAETAHAQTHAEPQIEETQTEPEIVAEIVTPAETPTEVGVQTEPAARPVAEVEVVSVEEPQQTAVPMTVTETETETEPEPEVEVLAYERISNDSGQEADVAVVNENGNTIEYYDFDLDGRADVRVCDINQNQQIDEGEAALVPEEVNIDMHEFRDAIGYDPLYAENNMPDYINDANTDSFMA